MINLLTVRLKHVMIEFDDRYNMLEKFGTYSCDELVNIPYEPHWARKNYSITDLGV
jgi:hypothetical protein